MNPSPFHFAGRITPAPRRERSRVVLDTNILVASAYAPGSASRRIVEACRRGELLAVVSPALRSEYDYILGRAIKDRRYEAALRQLLEQAIVMEPRDVPRVVREDAADDKLVALAFAADAAAIITNDHHLLRLDPLGRLRLVRPRAFVLLGGIS